MTFVGLLIAWWWSTAPGPDHTTFICVGIILVGLLIDVLVGRD